MLRKISTIAAMTLVLASAACNSITAPADGGTTGRNDRPDRTPDQVDKVCIDDLRAVEITAPGESQQIVAGQLVMVTWQTREICGGYYADVRVSYDGGQNFVALGSTKNALSMAWRLPELDGVALVVDVTVTDARGSVSDRLSLSHPLQGRKGDGDRDPDDVGE